jgi:hypothetical protein
MHELLIDIVKLVVPWIEMVGIAVVMWVALEGLIGLLLRMKSVLLKSPKLASISHIRVTIG